jgi:capsular exopolysaccharide synthesis family protein
VSTAQSKPSIVVQEDSAESSGLASKIPPVSSLLHVLWLKKWVILTCWLALSAPTGVMLSIFNLPKTYTASTILRFPNVVGAQTNVMRDVAITQGESIISVINSFQVLEATIRKLGLRLRIDTKEVFFRSVFKSVRYGENLGEGSYLLTLAPGRQAVLSYLPSDGKDEYVLFKGALKEGNRLSVPSLEIELKDEAANPKEPFQVEMSFSSLEEAAAELRKAMSTRPLGSSNFEVKLKDRDPWLVADIVNTLREQFMEVYYGTTEVQDVGILVQMEKDLEVAKSKLDKSQDELSKYYSVHPELAQREDRGGGGDNLVYLESRQDLDRLQGLRRKLQSTAKAKPGEDNPEAMVFWAMELLGAMVDAGDPKASILRGSLQDLNQRQTALRSSLGPEHPRIREVEAQKTEIYRQIEEAQAALAVRMEQDAGEIRRRMAASAPSRPVSVPVKVQLELERLHNVNENNQAIYDRLQESYNRAKLVTGSEFFKVTVVDPARPALYMPPSLKARLVVAAAAVLLLSILVPALFLLWPILFRKIWTREDIRRMLQLKTLGSMALNTYQQTSRKAKPAPAGGKDGDAPAPPLEIPRQPDPLLLFYGSAYTVSDLEAYRIIREETESFYRTRVQGKHCLLLTSTRPNEGKTLTACNLAMTFARKGKRTLLVDADFRLGRVDKIFNIPASTGLDELLSQPELSDAQFMESASLCFVSTMQRNLVIAPRSRFNANAGELVSSDRFKAFIRLAKELFDVVIVDTPPIMITPEPLSLTEVVDGVIFICRSGETVVSEAKEATQILEERGVRVAAVLNGIRSSPFEHNRYKKYSYYYQDQPRPDGQGAT